MPVTHESRHHLLDLFIHIEAALKQIPRYRQGNPGEAISANWSRFARDISTQLRDRVDAESRQLLITRPPMQEINFNGRPGYDPDTPPLPGGHRWQTAGARLIASSVRVRNNLVHGGKEDPARERYVGHDQAVVDAAIAVMVQAQQLLRQLR